MSEPRRHKLQQACQTCAAMVVIHGAPVGARLEIAHLAGTHTSKLTHESIEVPLAECHDWIRTQPGSEYIVCGPSPSAPSPR